jgi:ATP-dependent Lon protease
VLDNIYEFSLNLFQKILSIVPSHQLADLVASLVSSSYKEKLEILETLDLEDRFKKALPLVKRQTEGLKMIQNQRKHSNGGKKKPAPRYCMCRRL